MSTESNYQPPIPQPETSELRQGYRELLKQLNDTLTPKGKIILAGAAVLTAVGAAIINGDLFN